MGTELKEGLSPPAPSLTLAADHQHVSQIDLKCRTGKQEPNCRRGKRATACSCTYAIRSPVFRS